MNDDFPIKIAHLITTLDAGGTETMLSRLLTFMDGDRFSNHVICLTRMGDVGERIRSLGIPVYTMDMPRGKVSAGGLLNLFRTICSIRPHILQTWLYHGDLLGLILGRLSGVRKICWNVRCSYMNLKEYHASTRWALRSCAMLSRAPTLILTNSHEAKKFHIGLGYRSTGWQVIPNGFDLEEFRPDASARPWLLEQLNIDKGCGSFLIGFIARLDPMKDHSSFIRAACRVLTEGRDAHFVMVGRGVRRENRALSGLVPDQWAGRFHFLGSRSDINRITAGLTIATLASRGEGFPNVVCEAMACAVPCAVMDVGDSAYIVGDTGLVVPPGDTDAMAEAWSSMIEMGKESLGRLGIAARKRVTELYDIRQVAGKYESLYLSLNHFGALQE